MIRRRGLVFTLLGALAWSGCASPHAALYGSLPAAPVPLEERSIRYGPAVAIHEFSVMPFHHDAGSLMGGLAIDEAGDVWATGEYDIIHLSPNGTGKVLGLANGTRYLLGGIVWRNDDTIWYEEGFGESAYLGKTDPAGADLADIGESKYGVETPTTMITGTDYRVWYARCADSCQAGATGGNLDAYGSGPAVSEYSLGNYVGNSVASGANGEVYVTEANFSTSASAVARVATSGAVIANYALPPNAIFNVYDSPYTASGIVGGPDKNLWIVEGPIDKIARMSVDGVVTQFSIPTAHAGARNIVRGNDGALWFTESAANKIGRITTSGHITEYPVPTANAGLDGIISCTLFDCPGSPHGHIWFTENAAGKVGRLDF